MRVSSPVTFLALLLMPFVSAHAEEQVNVVLTVTVPKDTDEKATLYLAGNLNDWKANGSKLTRNSDGTYRYEAKLPKGQTLEYKITGGSWETVEKADGGGELENRTLRLDGDKEEKITVKAWANKPAAGAAQSATPQSSITGKVVQFNDFPGKVIETKRNVLIWLPPGYDNDKGTRYPVLYLHDGQNVFDSATSFAGEWHADETATELITSNKIKPIIMVAVANAGADRIDEYTPTRDDQRARGGKGETYCRYLIEDVKPVIDGHFRTLTDRDHTAVVGSSLGGLISLYIAQKHGDVFGQCGVMSPSLWWDNQQLIKSIEADPATIKRCGLWIDMGTDEGAKEESATFVSSLDTLNATLKKVGMIEEKDFVIRKFDGAKHNEQAWAERFGEVLQFFFAK